MKFELLPVRDLSFELTQVVDPFRGNVAVDFAAASSCSVQLNVIKDAGVLEAVGTTGTSAKVQCIKNARLTIANRLFVTDDGQVLIDEDGIPLTYDPDPGRVNRIANITPEIEAASVIEAALNQLRQPRLRVQATALIVAGLNKVRVISGHIEAQTVLQAIANRIRLIDGDIEAESVIEAVLQVIHQVAPEIEAASVIEAALNRVRHVSVAIEATASMSASVNRISNPPVAIEAESFTHVFVNDQGFLVGDDDTVPLTDDEGNLIQSDPE
ncbi:MAG: hypothetical protein ABQ298_03815 [Puniceicoccaceae bacterium]